MFGIGLFYFGASDLKKKLKVRQLEVGEAGKKA